MGEYAARRLARRGYQVLTRHADQGGSRGRGRDRRRASEIPARTVDLDRRGAAVAARRRERGRGGSRRPRGHAADDGDEPAGVFAIGDCARIPNVDDPDGRPHAPTAQNAVREAKVLAANIVARIDGGPAAAVPLSARIGTLASIGTTPASAWCSASTSAGWIAWFMWRGYYWSRLPGIGRKARVGIDWMLTALFGTDRGAAARRRSVERDGLVGHPAPAAARRRPARLTAVSSSDDVTRRAPRLPEDEPQPGSARASAAAAADADAHRAGQAAAERAAGAGRRGARVGRSLAAHHACRRPGPGAARPFRQLAERNAVRAVGGRCRSCGMGGDHGAGASRPASRATGRGSAARLIPLVERPLPATCAGGDNRKPTPARRFVSGAPRRYAGAIQHRPGRPLDAGLGTPRRLRRGSGGRARVRRHSARRLRRRVRRTCRTRTHGDPRRLRRGAGARRPAWPRPRPWPRPRRPRPRSRTDRRAAAERRTRGGGVSRPTDAFAGWRALRVAADPSHIAVQREWAC